MAVFAGLRGLYFLAQSQVRTLPAIDDIDAAELGLRSAVDETGGQTATDVDGPDERIRGTIENE